MTKSKTKRANGTSKDEHLKATPSTRPPLPLDQLKVGQMESAVAPNGLVGLSCTVISCSNPATEWRNGLPYCSPACIRSMATDDVTTPASRKRGAEHLTPPSPRWADLGKNDLLQKLREAHEEIEKLNRLNASLEKELNNAKIALANDLLKKITPAATAEEDGSAYSYSEMLQRGSNPRSAILTAEATGTVNITDIDKILGSRGKGPIPQCIKQVENKILMTFGDEKSRDRASDILASSDSAKKFLSNINKPKRLYPAVAKFADLRGTKEELLESLRFRNPAIGESLASVRTIFKSKDGVSGHVKMLFSSKAIRDLLIQRGEVFLPDRRCPVVLPDPNREVRRCYKCQKYGHISTMCSATHDTCGKCNENHRTNVCTVAADDRVRLRCANCLARPTNVRLSDGNHMAGSNECPEHKRAVRRYLETQ